MRSAFARMLLLAVCACGSSSEQGSTPSLDAASSDVVSDAGSGTEAASVAKEAADANHIDAAASCTPPCSGGTLCARQQCLPPAPVVTTDTELCGVNHYAGTFTVKSGVHVTCASGELEIEADDIVVEAGATVAVAATSTRAGGYEPTLCTGLGQVFRSGASGGGYAGLGGTGGSGTVLPYSTSCHRCPGRIGGEVYGSDHDAIVEPGSRGGDGCNLGGSAECPSANLLAGGLGGGVVRMIAAQSVRIFGQVRADGGHATANAPPLEIGAGGGGGGSGGGILMQAPIVEVGASAIVSTMGGGGSHGYRPDASCLGAWFDAQGGFGSAGRVKIFSSIPTTPLGNVVGLLTQGTL